MFKTTMQLLQCKLLVSFLISSTDGCVYIWTDMYFSMCKHPFQAAGKVYHRFMNSILVKDNGDFFPPLLEQKCDLKPLILSNY